LNVDTIISDEHTVSIFSSIYGHTVNFTAMKTSNSIRKIILFYIVLCSNDSVP
jgi:hypothetical protein